MPRKPPDHGSSTFTANLLRLGGELLQSILKTSFALSQLNLHGRNDILQTVASEKLHLHSKSTRYDEALSHRYMDGFRLDGVFADDSPGET